jgi:hypothetical protein
VQHTDKSLRPSTFLLNIPAADMAGQLRLLRKGAAVAFLMCDKSTKGTFQELYRCDFGTDDLTTIRYVVNTNGEACAVDARLVDLRIRSGVLLNTVSATPPTAYSRIIWIGASGLTALLLIGVVVSTRLLFRQRRRQLVAAEAPLEAVSETRSIACQCSNCGRSLKVRERRAGKRLKCPDCGNLVTVHGN